MKRAFLFITDEDRAKNAEYMRERRAKQKEEGYKLTEHQIELRRAGQKRYEDKLKSENPELFKERSSQSTKRYREKYPERVKAASMNWRNNNRDQFNTTRRKWHNKNIVHMMYLMAKYRARDRGIEFTIEESDIPEMGTHCPVFGYPFDIGEGDFKNKMKTDNSPSLDRIDPKKGYTPGNVWIITYRANRVKNDATANEHEMIATAMRSRGVI